jgi:hypothetical protein
MLFDRRKFPLIPRLKDNNMQNQCIGYLLAPDG